MVEQPKKIISVNTIWNLFLSRQNTINRYADLMISDNENGDLIVISSAGVCGVGTSLKAFLSVRKTNPSINTFFYEYGFSTSCSQSTFTDFQKIGDNLYLTNGNILRTSPPIIGIKSVQINRFDRVLSSCGGSYHKTFYSKIGNEHFLLDEFITAYPENDFFYSTFSKYNNDGTFSVLGKNYLGYAYGYDLVDRQGPQTFCNINRNYFREHNTQDNGLKTFESISTTGNITWRIAIKKGNIIPINFSNCDINSPNPSQGYYKSESYCLDLSAFDINYYGWSRLGNTTINDLLIYCDNSGRTNIVYGGVIIQILNGFGGLQTNVFLDSNFILWGVSCSTYTNPIVNIYKTDLSAILEPISKNIKTKPKLLSYNLKNDTRPVSITRGFIS